MQITFTEKVIDALVESFSAEELGIFIALLSNKYIKYYGMIDKKFIKNLTNSLKILKESEEK